MTNPNPNPPADNSQSISPAQDNSANADIISQVLSGKEVPVQNGPLPGQIVPGENGGAADPTPAPPLPLNPSHVNLSNLLVNVEQQEIQKALDLINSQTPSIQKNLEQYAAQYVTALLAGKDPKLIPTITAQTLSGQELTITDAKSRSLRTLAQGFGLDCVWAIVSGIGTISGDEFFTKTGWIMLAALAGKTVLQTAISYAQRIRFAPSYQQQ